MPHDHHDILPIALTLLFEAQAKHGNEIFKSNMTRADAEAHLAQMPIGSRVVRLDSNKENPSVVLSYKDKDGSIYHSQYSAPKNANNIFELRSNTSGTTLSDALTALTEFNPPTPAVKTTAMISNQLQNNSAKSLEQLAQETAIAELKNNYPDMIRPHYSREDAIAELTNATPGTAIIRYTSNSNSITVSCKAADDTIRHLNFNYLAPDASTHTMTNFADHFVTPSGISIHKALAHIDSLKPNEVVTPSAQWNYAAPNVNPDLMIIATQVSASKNEEENKVTLGGTGKAIQANVGGGLIHMHRNKKANAKDKQALNNHLHPDGLLVITGHGNIGATNIQGTYETYDQSVHVKYTAKDYVDMALSQQSLKSGDHLNVLLYVCHGAQGTATTPSLAQQVAQEFATHGISTSIVASVTPVERIGGLQAGDIADQLVKFRAVPGDVRLLNTTVTQAGYIAKQEELPHPDNFVISRFGSGNQKLITKNMLDYLDRKEVKHGEHHKYAAALTYFLGNRQTGGPSHADHAHKLFLALPPKDKRLVVNQLKIIDPEIYKQLQRYASKTIEIGSPWQRRPRVEKTEANTAAPDDPKSRFKPS